MAERSTARAKSKKFSRGRLVVGVLLVAIVGGVVAFAFSRLRSAPDPGRLIYAARQGVFSRDLETGEDRRLADLPESAEIAIPSPDGRWVAYAEGQGAVWLRSLESDRRFQVAERLAAPLGWSPDGRIVVGELLSDGDLVAVDPDGARDILMSGGSKAGSAPVWIDEDRFAIARDEDEFIVVDGGDRSEPVEGTPIAPSADGAELLISRGGRVFAANVDGTEVDEPREIFRGEVTWGASSPAGFVAIAARDHRDRDGVYVFEGGTRSTRVVDRAADWVGWPRAGATVLYAHDGAAYAVELPDGKPKRLTRRGADVLPVFAFAIAP